MYHERVKRLLWQSMSYSNESNPAVWRGITIESDNWLPVVEPVRLHDEIASDEKVKS